MVNRSGGLVDANVPTGTLNVDPGTGGLTNQGLMRASNGGFLLLNGNGGGGFDNTGGTISALDGSEVQLTNGVSITGGILNTVGTGLIRTLNSAVLTDLTIAGAFRVTNNTSLTLVGTINNTASITLNSLGNFTDLVINSDVTLVGGGVVNIANAGRVRGFGTLFIGGLAGESQTIQGEGNNSGSGLGANELTLVNRSGGLVDANVSGAALNVDPGTGGLTNEGLMRASNGGFLLLNGNGGGGFDNTDGTISALDGSEVQLTNGVSITGGILNTAGTGLFQTLNSAVLTDLTLAGAFRVTNNTSLTLVGTINNTAIITLNSLGNFTDLLTSGNVTLTGNGTINLNSAARIRGSGILTNAGNTIAGEANNSGSGLGANEIGIVNQAGGVISANVSGLILNVDPDVANGLVNQGTMQAVSGGILLLNGNGGGTFTNSGTIKATGGTLQFTGAVTSSGTVDVGADSLSISGSGSYTQSAGTFRLAGGSVTSSSALIFNGGLIDARGTINAAITNNANIQPALGGTGLTVTGAVTLLSASRLTFQLGGLAQGSQYGFLNANGSVALNGNLVASFVNSFQAGNDDNFTVLNSTALSGAFTNVASGGRLTTTDSSGSFLVTYDGSTVVLSDFQPTGLRAPSSSAKRVTGSAIRPRSPAAEPQEDALTATPGASGPAVSSSAPNNSNPTADHSTASPSTTGPTTLPATRTLSGRTASANGRGRVVSIALENTDQLLGVLEGPEAATTRGKVTINAKGMAKKTAPRPGIEDFVPRQPKDSSYRRATRDREITDRAID